MTNINISTEISFSLKLYNPNGNILYYNASSDDSSVVQLFSIGLINSRLVISIFNSTRSLQITSEELLLPDTQYLVNISNIQTPDLIILTLNARRLVVNRNGSYGAFLTLPGVIRFGELNSEAQVIFIYCHITSKLTLVRNTCIKRLPTDQPYTIFILIALLDLITLIILGYFGFAGHFAYIPTNTYNLRY